MKKQYKTIINYLIFNILSICIYIIAGKLGLTLAFFNNNISPVWPPTGIAIASLVILGYKYWPSVLIGAFIVNFTSTPSIPVSLGIASGNTLEALFGAFLMVKYAGGKDEFEKVKNTFVFLFIAALTPFVSVIIGVTTLWFGGLIKTNEIFTSGLTWWTGDALGALLFIPLIITIYNKAPIRIKKQHYVEIFLAMFILFFISSIIFLGWPLQINKSYPLAFMCIPPIIWIAWRSCIRVSSIAGVVLSTIAIIGTVFKGNIFNTGLSLNNSLVILQLFISIVLVTSIIISTLSVEYRKSIANLENKKRAR